MSDEVEPVTSAERIYRLKLTLAGSLLVVLGLTLNLLGTWLSSIHVSTIIIDFVDALSSAVLFTGALGILLDWYSGKERKAQELAIQREVQEQMIPNYVDAVIHAIDASPAALKRVATPELLDSVATNAMSLRLGDEQFAREIYEDVRDQAIRAPERWHGVDVTIRLSTAVERSTGGTPLLEALVQWEYTTVPSHHVRRFACTSDREDYAEMLGDIPATSCWLMTPRPGLDASSRDCFELLSFSVNGEDRPIRRTARKTGQTYSARIGDDLVREGAPVRIKHMFRVVTPASGHRLFFELAQPSRDVTLTVDYTATSITKLSISDLVTSLRRADISQWPRQLDAKVISAELPGWVLPRAGFTLVWTLANEQTEDVPSDAATSSVHRAA